MRLLSSLLNTLLRPTRPIMDKQHLSAALARVSDPSFDSVELFYASNPEWPAAGRPLSGMEEGGQLSQQQQQQQQQQQDHQLDQRKRRKIHIAVFDSSFNPPTRAHLAISLTLYPPPTDLSSSSSSSPSNTIPEFPTAAPNETYNEPYTARLLLLSARNVDKTPKPGIDATFVQRIEMMRLQALDMEAVAGRADQSAGNVAVAALNHPTFVGKSDILLRWLRQRFSPASTNADAPPEIRLTFLIGTDTLLRLFIPKYYTPSPLLGPDMPAHLSKLFTLDGSDIVVAHRGTTSAARGEEETFIQSRADCRALVRGGKIRFVVEGEVGEEEREMSSTRVRRAVREGREREARLLMGKRVGDYVFQEGLYAVPP